MCSRADNLRAFTQLMRARIHATADSSVCVRAEVLPLTLPNL